GGPGKLNFVVEPSGREDDLLEFLQEMAFGHRVLVQAVHDVVAGEIVQETRLQLRMIMAVVERSGAREEIEITPSAFVEYAAAQCGAEHRGPAPAVAPYL